MSQTHARRNSYVTGLVDRMMARIDLSEHDDVILAAMHKRLMETLACLNMAMTIDMKDVTRDCLMAQWSAIVMSIGFDMEYYRRIRDVACNHNGADGRIVELKMCYLA